MLKHSKEISKSRWKLYVWSPIILGAIVFSIFNSSFFMPTTYVRASMYGAMGGVLMGWGFGLLLARVWKIEGVDN